MNVIQEVPYFRGARQQPLECFKRIPKPWIDRRRVSMTSLTWSDSTTVRALDLGTLLF